MFGDFAGLVSLASRLFTFALLACIAAIILKGLWNISPFNTLYKYPGPLLWRLSRLPASYHHATGDLYICISAIHERYGPTVRIAPDELSFTAPEAWAHIYNSRPQLEKSAYHFPGGDDPDGLPEGMVTAPDAEHMRIRRLASPAFLNSAVLEVEPILQHYSNTLCSQLTAASEEGSQDMVEWSLWTLNDVIGHLALDLRFECLAKRRMHPWPSFLLRALRQTAAVNQFRRFGFPPRMLYSVMPQRIIDAKSDFVNSAKLAIDQRLERENLGKGQNERNPDIMGLMLREMKGGERLSRPDIASNMSLIVGAGAETTSML